MLGVHPHTPSTETANAKKSHRLWTTIRGRPYSETVHHTTLSWPLWRDLRSSDVRRVMPRNRSLCLLFGLLSSFTLGCGDPPPPLAVAHVEGQPAADGGSVAPSKASAVDEAALDKSISPCGDFYAFACGGWKQANPIPAEEAAFYRSFHGIRNRNEIVLHQLLEEFAAGKRTDEPFATELGAFYASCLDEGRIETDGLKPLEPIFTVIDAVSDKKTLTAALAQLAANGLSLPFDFSSSQDFKDTTRVIAEIDQSGLGLPDREYYFPKESGKAPVATKEKAAKERAQESPARTIADQYRAHVGKMFELTGLSAKSASSSANVVFAFERELAGASMKKEELREPEKLYHLMDKAGVESALSNLSVTEYLKAIGAGDALAFNVAQLAFIKKVNTLANGDFARWRTYLKWQVLHKLASRLPAAFVLENFKLAQILQGAKALPDRWKRCVRSTDGAMGEALGHAFVKATLGEKGKEDVQSLIAAIEHEMNISLTKLPWMDDATRSAALTKLVAIDNKVAHPEVWRPYTGIGITKGSYATNTLAANKFEFARQIMKIGKPVDRKEWLMSPPTVNAYYEPLKNEMVFPAGILQPPFYDMGRTSAGNFGSIGMVMGHELTHGFDDEGNQFDAKGNLRNWWSASVKKEFETRAACLQKQYDSYEVAKDVHVNGKLTLGENIADLGGLKLAYLAMKTQLEKEQPLVEGRSPYSPQQEFFIAFAQGWCANERDEFLRQQVATNPHSPARFRVNGPASHFKPFAEAFSCKDGDAMVPKDRCDIW